MLPRELSGTEDLLCPQLSCLTLCLGPSLAPSALTLSFSLPGKKEAFEVAEGKLIPYLGPSSLPVKTRFMQLIFTLIHLSTGSLPCTLPPFLFFLCQSLCLRSKFPRDQWLYFLLFCLNLYFFIQEWVQEKRINTVNDDNGDDVEKEEADKDVVQIEYPLLIVKFFIRKPRKPMLYNLLQKSLFALAILRQSSRNRTLVSSASV